MFYNCVKRRVPDRGSGAAELCVFSRYQNSPEITPFSSTSIRSAAGTFGSPGIVMISPVRTTANPAPAEIFTFFTVTVKPSGAPSFSRIVGKAVLRLCDAYGYVSVSELLETRDLLLSLRCKAYAVAAVHLFHNGFDLFRNRHIGLDTRT